jgi:hypothetical protein
LVQDVGPFDRPLLFLESFSPELFPTDFSMVLSGKPPPNNPPIPGNLAGGGAPPLLEEFPPFLSPPGVIGADLPGDRLLFAFMSLFEFELGLLPPNGADRSLVTVFFSALPFCMELSKAPRSEGLLLGFPPPPPTFMGGGLGGAGAPGGGPGGGGGGGIILQLSLLECKNPYELN